jgi:hypothetical protein
VSDNVVRAIEVNVERIALIAIARYCKLQGVAMHKLKMAHAVRQAFAIEGELAEARGAVKELTLGDTPNSDAAPTPEGGPTG